MMPLRVRRKGRGMEKGENLYRTARVQNVVPRHRDHVVEICDRNASSFRDFRIVARGFDAVAELISEQSIAALLPARG
jgi:hypothetical protein